jgi:ATP-binding cassette subfamily C protein LapB
MKPSLLLLDEPTANLDQETEIRVLQAIFKELSANTTLVLITHKMQLLSLIQRLVVLSGGQITHDGPVQSVVEQLRARKNAVSSPEVTVKNETL